MAISDEQLLQFFRRKADGLITQRDIDLSSDVCTLQPLLYYLAYSIDAKVLVEIGVADGSTTVPFVKAAEECGGKVYSVDPSANGCNDCKRLMKDFGVSEENWEFCNTGSDEFFMGFNQEIDMAFIDGDHSSLQLARDVRNCCQRLSRKGIVFVSDYTGIPDRTNKDYYDAERYTLLRDYDERCSWGIYEGLKLVLGDFPWLGHVHLADRGNGSVIIAKHFNRERGDFRWTV